MVVPDSKVVHYDCQVDDRAAPLDWGILCPATNPRTQARQRERHLPEVACATCLLCRGTSANAPSIWEVAHGKNKENHTW